MAIMVDTTLYDNRRMRLIGAVCPRKVVSEFVATSIVVLNIAKLRRVLIYSTPRNTPTPFNAFWIAALTNFAWTAAKTNSWALAPAFLTHHEINTADQGVLTPGKLSPRACQYRLICAESSGSLSLYS